MEISDSAVLITGAASGLGAATARSLHARGAHVILFDHDRDGVAAIAGALGGNADWVCGDVTKESDVVGAVEFRTPDKPLRVLVNCAGIGYACRLVGKDSAVHGQEAFEKVVRVNLLGTFNVMRMAARRMSQNRPLADGERGVIVNTASIAAFDGQIGQIAYSASKGGIVAMTLPAARDLASAGIRVMAIAPGIMDTPLLGQLPSEVRSSLAVGVPFPKRLGLPEDFATVVEMIVSNGYLNGEVIRVDGALRMGPR